MTEVIATVEQAAGWLARGSAPGADWNPVYRALSSAGPETPPPPSVPAPSGDATALIHHQMTAPAVMVVAVTDDPVTSRMRIALDPEGPTVESSRGDAPSRWARVRIREVPAMITELLESAGIAPGPPRLTIEREADGLRPTPEQNAAARAALARGARPEEAYGSIPDLDERLRDALTATGARVSLALTLHDPTGAVAEEPVSFSRLWVTGRRGLYRTDSPASGDGAIRAVSRGDVLGTALPLLDEGMRFSAACAAQDSAR